jgi:hypothetical protein
MIQLVRLLHGGLPANRLAVAQAAVQAAGDRRRAVGGGEGAVVRRGKTREERQVRARLVRQVRGPGSRGGAVQVECS